MCELSEGLTNKNFLVSSDHARAVIRLNCADEDQLGIDRDREARILRSLARLGYMADILYQDDDALVTLYLKGTSVTPRALQDPKVAAAVSLHLTTIQAVTLLDESRFCYRDHCSSLAAQLTSKQLQCVDWPALCEAAKSIDLSEWTPRLCHHDLVPENIRMTQQGVYFIDWEYAALGHPAFDWVRLYGACKAVVARLEGQFSLETLKTLAYLQRGIDKLWFAVQDSRKRDNDRRG